MYTMLDQRLGRWAEVFAGMCPGFFLGRFDQIYIVIGVISRNPTTYLQLPTVLVFSKTYKHI